MPSIALFIKQLLSEDKYSADFSDRISERIKELNAAQLQGIYNHLVSTAKNAKTQTWAAANNELVSRIEGVLKERVAEAAKIEKILEEDRLKRTQRQRKLKEAKIEQRRVMKMIAENARKTAEDAVREEEAKRIADEKLEIMAKVFQGEEKRNDWFKKIALFFVIGIVVICASVQDIIIIIPCIFVVILVSSALAYRAQQFTVVVPRMVDETEVEMEIERRGEILKKKAVTVLQEKERKFQEQQARDEQERRARKALKKQQAKFEANLMATRRAQQLAKAQEIMSRRSTSVGGSLISNTSGCNTPVSARSEVFTFQDKSNRPETAVEFTRSPSQLPTIRDLPDKIEDDFDEEGYPRLYGDRVVVLDDLEDVHTGTDHMGVRYSTEDTPMHVMMGEDNYEDKEEEESEEDGDDIEVARDVAIALAEAEMEEAMLGLEAAADAKENTDSGPLDKRKSVYLASVDTFDEVNTEMKVDSQRRGEYDKCDQKVSAKAEPKYPDGQEDDGVLLDIETGGINIQDHSPK